MLGFLIVALCAVCSIQATIFSQNLTKLHFHAKFGQQVQLDNPQTDERAVDKHISRVVEKFITERIPKHPIKTNYGPITDVVIPGIILPQPINLKIIEVTGLRRLQMNSLHWRFAQNRVEFNVTIPKLLIDVIFDQTLIKVDQYFPEEFLTDIRLTAHLSGLKVFGSVGYNMTTQANIVNSADLEINIREALFELNVIYGAEEIRLLLSQIINNPLEDIMDAILKVVVREINKNLPT